jgi:hypothetical protein
MCKVIGNDALIAREVCSTGIRQQASITPNTGETSTPDNWENDTHTLPGLALL